MSIFTISPDFFRSIDENEKIYLTDILFVFTNRNTSYKVTTDKHGYILDIYKGIKENAEVIKMWLDFMTFHPSPFEKINVDIKDIDCEETKFIKVCKETKGYNNLIVYSIQNLKKFNCEKKIIRYEGKEIILFDRDDAISELTPKKTIITDSIVAMGSAKMKKIKSKHKKII